MRPLSRTPLALAVAGLALAAPAAAQAAESFVGVTGGDHLVTFHSDTIPALSRPAAIDGLPAGQRLMALDTRPGAGLLALSTSGAVYALDAGHHRVTATVATLPFAVPADAAATLTVAADGATARVIAGGHDATIDLAAGTVVRDDPAVAPLAVDLGAGGVLRGLDPAGAAIVSLDASGEHQLAALPGVRATGASAATGAADGSTYAVTGIPRRNAPQQSRMLHFDPATGQARSASMFFLRDLEGIAATGTVADDRAAPRARVRIPRQSLGSALHRRGFVAELTTSEGGQTVVSARTGHRIRGFGLLTAERGGRYRVVVHSRVKDLRAAAGHRVRLHFTVHDYAGNKRTLDAWLTLGR